VDVLQSVVVSQDKEIAALKLQLIKAEIEEIKADTLSIT
jgi:hypothetical protein